MASVIKGKSKYVARHIRAAKNLFDNPRESLRNQQQAKTDKRTAKKKKTPVPDTHSDDEDGDNWMGKGMGFFSPDDEYELMCQGVNPWDDDAAVSPCLTGT